MPRSSLLLLGAVLLGAAPAGADPVPALDLRGFSPPLDPRVGMAVDGPATPGPGDWDTGLWLSWARRPVTLREGGERVGSPVEHQLSLDQFLFVGMGDRLGLGVAVPAILYQVADLPPEEAARVGAQTGLPATALGDVAFEAKATLLPGEALGGFSFGLSARLIAPTGDRSSYASEGTTGGVLRALGELALVAVDLRASAGVQMRGEPREFAGEEFGHALPWGFGASVHPRVLGLDDEGHWLWSAEAHGAVAVTPDLAAAAQSPARLSLSARYTPGELSWIGGVEAPLLGAPGSPAPRLVLGVAWSPRFLDADGDRIADEVDDCAELPEDRDGFEDGDGCPDFDDDDDGVPDDVDRCRLTPEDEDGFQDEDGCVDPDDDQDGVPDRDDACPREPAGAQPGPRPGCPLKDRDRDGIENTRDHCPRLPEDVDGFKDDDGCPDLDDDGDRILDTDDACPRQAGEARDDARLNGCPNPDPDGDTFDGEADRCPAEPEDFDEVDDGDGCPDPDPAGKPGRPLVVLGARAGAPTLRWRRAPRFVVKDGSVEIDPASEPDLRAMAAALAARPGWVALIGVRPGRGDDAEQEALGKAFALVQQLRTLSHRDEIAESVAWSAVRKEAGAEATGIGLLLLSAPREAPPPPRPATPVQPPPARAPTAPPGQPPAPPAPPR